MTTLQEFIAPRDQAYRAAMACALFAKDMAANKAAALQAEKDPNPQAVQYNATLAMAADMALDFIISMKQIADAEGTPEPQNAKMIRPKRWRKHE